MKRLLKSKLILIFQKEPGIIEDVNTDGILVNTKDYLIKLKDIKLEGKNRTLVKDFINGIKKEDFIGVRLNGRYE